MGGGTSWWHHHWWWHNHGRCCFFVVVQDACLLFDVVGFGLANQCFGSREGATSDRSTGPSTVPVAPQSRTLSPPVPHTRGRMAPPPPRGRRGRFRSRGGSRSDRHNGHKGRSASSGEFEQCVVSSTKIGAWDPPITVEKRRHGETEVEETPQIRPPSQGGGRGASRVPR